METAQDFSRGVTNNVSDVIVGKGEVIETPADCVAV